MKSVYHTMNILFTKAKFFVIRYGISQTIQIQGIMRIIIITNTIPVTKRIFDISYYSY